MLSLMLATIHPAAKPARFVAFTDDPQDATFAIDRSPRAARRKFVAEWRRPVEPPPASIKVCRLPV